MIPTSSRLVDLDVGTMVSVNRGRARKFDIRSCIVDVMAINDPSRDRENFSPHTRVHRLGHSNVERVSIDTNALRVN